MISNGSSHTINPEKRLPEYTSCARHVKYTCRGPVIISNLESSLTSLTKVTTAFNLIYFSDGLVFVVVNVVFRLYFIR